MTDQSGSLFNTSFPDFNSFNFVNSFPSDYRRLVTTNKVSNENRNLDRLKAKIDRFIQEHPDIIQDIRNYFYDEMTIHALKLSLKLPFNKTDMIRTKRLFERFFAEHEINIRIIFNFFFDELKPFLLNNRFSTLTSDFPRINMLLNFSSREALLILLKTRGAQFLMTKLYSQLILSNENENSSVQSSVQTSSTLNQMIFIAIIGIVTYYIFYISFDQN